MQIVHGGLAAFNGLALGLPSQDMLSYFQSQVSNIPQMIGQYGTMFKEAVQQTYDRFTNSDVMRAAKLALQHVHTAENRDVIRPLCSMEDFQTAQPIMQRWIMACPEIREVYHKQRCDGYSGVYVDNHPGQVGEKHYDYRRVMTGVVQVNEDEGDFVIKHYYEDLEPGDADLFHEEKVAILSTWDIGRTMIKAMQQDPTNQFGGDL